MALIRWNPWNLNSLFEDDWDLPTVPGISRMFGQGLNIYETEKEVVTEVALPGIPDNKIDISIDDGVVRISASNSEKEEGSENKRYYMSNLSNSYNYSFRLPEGIVTDQEPEAILSQGVLKLSFRKVEPTAPKKIKVKSIGAKETTLKQGEEK